MSAMTLEQVRDFADAVSRCSSPENVRRFNEAAGRWVYANLDHLAQPAQAVDVGAIREVVGWLETREGMRVDIGGLADKLTRALSVQKAGPVGDGVYPVAVAPKDAPSHSIEMLVYLPEHGWRRGFYTGFNAERGEWPWSAESFPGRTNRTITHWAYLPASPTPDKEGQP